MSKEKLELIFLTEKKCLLMKFFLSQHVSPPSSFHSHTALIWWRTYYLVYIVIGCVCVFVPVCGNSLWFVSQCKCIFCLFFLKPCSFLLLTLYESISVKSSNAKKTKQILSTFKNAHTYSYARIECFVCALASAYQCM